MNVKIIYVNEVPVMRKRPKSRVKESRANGSDHREGALQCRAEWFEGLECTRNNIYYMSRTPTKTPTRICAAKQMGWRDVPERDVKLGGHVCGWCGIGVVLCGHDMAGIRAGVAGCMSTTKRGPL